MYPNVLKLKTYYKLIHEYRLKTFYFENLNKLNIMREYSVYINVLHFMFVLSFTYTINIYTENCAFVLNT